jgi:hypothetical protein
MSAVAALFGGTTWLALDQPFARDPGAHRRLTVIALLLSLLVAVSVLIAAVVMW